MSSPTPSVTDAQAAASTAPPVTSAPAGAPAGNFTAATTVSSLNELKETAPQVYNAMMQGIAQNICSAMKDHQKHLKEMMREAQRDAEGRS